MAGGRLQRCKKCEPCLREPCAECGNCLDSPKFGGPNVRKQACIYKKCKDQVRKTPEGLQTKKEMRLKKRGRPVSVKSDAYFRNIEKILPATDPLENILSPNAFKKFENTSLNVTKVTETGYVSIGQGYTEQAGTKHMVNKQENTNQGYTEQENTGHGVTKQGLTKQKLTRPRFNKYRVPLNRSMPRSEPTHRPVPGPAYNNHPASYFSNQDQRMMLPSQGSTVGKLGIKMPTESDPTVGKLGIKLPIASAPTAHTVPTAATVHTNTTNFQTNPMYPSIRTIDESFLTSPVVESVPSFQPDEPVNLAKRRRVEETPNLSTDAFVQSLDKHLLEIVDGDEVVNVDKMYNITDGIVDDGDLGIEDISTEETVGGNDSHLLQNDSDLLHEFDIPGKSEAPSLEEMTHEVEETDIIKFLDKDDIISSFINIFQDADVEEKMTLFDKLLEPAGVEVQDKLMTHLFRTVQKRKFGKQPENKNNDVRITEKFAAQILQNARPPGPPVRPILPAPQVAKKSTTKPRSAMSLLVCDCRLYRTTNQEKLKNHIEAVHGGITHHEWQTCGECDHSFKFWEDLKIHIGKDHSLKKGELIKDQLQTGQSTNQKPVNLPCTTCRRQFQTVADLYLHRGEEEACRLACKECPDTFTDERDMMEHMFQH